ncbi:MAG: shikimate dehydrogenase [Candidatus Thioglobus sp.]|nr:shikimate dehydrogenase [Candidatus Thioglobus sp.]
MKRFAVFGNPIQHSLSPSIHQQFAEQTGISISYQKILAPTDGFAAAAADFIQQGGSGFNITVPFKLDAFQLAHQHSAYAKIAGAVNTIKIQGADIIGENTDGTGLVSDLMENLELELNAKTILILGAGGATRGILLPLLEQNPKRLMVANRNASKALELSEDFSKYGKTCGFGLEKIKNEPVDIIINATSASLDNQMPAIADGCAAGAVCYDLMYGKQTPFMNWAKAHGARVISDGLGMLVGQAAASFEFWTGKKPDAQAVIQNLKP